MTKIGLARKIETSNHSWIVREEKIIFPKERSWATYVDSKRLEITCGEAPFLASRYDTSTGELLIPPLKRIGLLDRKLRIVNENTKNYEDWIQWTFRAFESCYGYEYQGDNVLIARINLFLTFVDYYIERWKKHPSKELLEQIAIKIVWNIWQMDGLKKIPPCCQTNEDSELLPLFDELELESLKGKKENVSQCNIFDWRSNSSLVFRNLGEESSMKKKLFDYVIGNPPYQEGQIPGNGENSLKNFAPPVYDKFMEGAYQVSNKVILIHPARFLFNAGSTPKSWNEKMLQDKHLKVVYYEEDGNKVFPSLSSPLKGGVAITYHDKTKVFGPIVAFTKFLEVNDILHKVLNTSSFESLTEIMYSRTAYRLTENLHAQYPEIRYLEDEQGNNIGLLSKGHDYDMSSNIMSLIPHVFFDLKPEDGKSYIRILGRVGTKRIYKFIRRDFVKKVENLDCYKVYIAQASGSGEFGEALSEPVVEGPGVGATETFLSIGKFKTIKEARAAEKYIKTKFVRTLLSILKVTQNGNKPVWKMIPLQNFTASSDIDWSKSIHDIDLQLYRKYGLSQKEIIFIEDRVKEML